MATIAGYIKFYQHTVARGALFDLLTLALANRSQFGYTIGMSDYGPKLSALTEQQRVFVIHYVETGGDNATESARKAGYADRDDAGIRVQAHRLLHNKRVIDAIREESERQLSVDLPEARLALARVLKNPQHKDHFSAIKLLLGTQGISAINKTEHVHSIDTAGLVEQIKMLEAQLPPAMLRRLKGPLIIDVTPTDTGGASVCGRDEPAEDDWRAP